MDGHIGYQVLLTPQLLFLEDPRVHHPPFNLCLSKLCSNDSLPDTDLALVPL